MSRPGPGNRGIGYTCKRCFGSGVERAHAVASESAISDHMTVPESPEPDDATQATQSQHIRPRPHIVKTFRSPLTKPLRLKRLGSPRSDRPTTNPKMTPPLVARAVRCPCRPSRGLDRSGRIRSRRIRVPLRIFPSLF